MKIIGLISVFFLLHVTISCSNEKPAPEKEETAPYSVREESWWIELTAIENVNSLQFDKSVLEQTDGSNDAWREVFVGNVELAFNSDTLFTDSLFWNPKLKEIRAANCKIKQVKNDVTSVISGSGLLLDSDFSSWEMDRVVGFQSAD